MQEQKFMTGANNSGDRTQWIILKPDLGCLSDVNECEGNDL